MKLIIAEKPSLARNIAAGIGQMTRRDGYLEGQGYLITWAFGHLFSLVDIEAYSEGGDSDTVSRKWTMDNLPCFPTSFRYELRKGEDGKTDRGVEKQFRIISSLCNRPDVDAIINAGDADREGEIIVRTCIEKALKTKKPCMRLWLPDQTPQTVAAALSSMASEDEYRHLADEGYARTFIDWLYGVNLTRYATLQTGRLLRVGRVIVPIVKAIYDRDMEIAHFRPEVYYAIHSKAKTNGEEVDLLSKQKFPKAERAEAQALCDAYNAAGAVVTDKKSKQDSVAPGKLYSLSTLQNVLGKKYKMSMKDSLEIVQGLYEKGYLTYPRTNSEYLATAEKDKIRAILAGVAKLGYPVRFKDSKYIFDDSKIESHSALTPTYKIPQKDALSPKEAQVYSTVFRRFVAVFCSEPCVAEKSELTVAVGDLETFVLKGTILLEPGWTKYDDYNRKDKVLPRLEIGDRVEIAFLPEEKETTPPRHYTIETLNNYLKNPFREEKAKASEEGFEGGEGEADDEDYRAMFEGLELGTEATRTGIIDNARKSRYIELKKDVYSILPDGIFLIESLVRLHITMDKYKTSQMGQALKRVFRGNMTVQESVALAQSEITQIFIQTPDLPPPPKADHGKLGEVMGVCPKCGKNVICGKSAYGCMGYTEGCDFRMPFVLCGRGLSAKEVQYILAHGESYRLEGFVSRAGRRFSAWLKLVDGKLEFDFHTEEDPKPKKSTATSKPKTAKKPKTPAKPKKE
ncbi:MAG: topoisomerase C-terminal repeat-containing protein [Clostridia bacterium]|nr:topoisomerase C-terminal repeat-containing protein [Clostridia bacterium]